MINFQTTPAMLRNLISYIKFNLIRPLKTTGHLTIDLLLKHNAINHLISIVIAGFATTLIFQNSTILLQDNRYISSLELMTQILSILVGFLSIGVSYYISSYDEKESINELRKKYAEITKEIRCHWFNPRKEHKRKIDNPTFRKSLYSKTNRKKLVLYRKIHQQYHQVFINRPYFDGVCYLQVRINSEEVVDKNELNVKAFTELFVCSFKCLKGIRRMRKKQCALVSKKRGTHGSIEWLKKFETIDMLKRNTLPATVGFTEACEIIEIAIKSTHYMFEEFNRHSENIDWKPSTFSDFLYEYSAYILWLFFMIRKFNSLRVEVADIHTPRFIEKAIKNNLPTSDNQILANDNRKLTTCDHLKLTTLNYR